jgi:hypothetical protein
MDGWMASRWMASMAVRERRVKIFPSEICTQLANHSSAWYWSACTCTRLHGARLGYVIEILHFAKLLSQTLCFADFEAFASFFNFFCRQSPVIIYHSAIYLSYDGGKTIYLGPSEFSSRAFEPTWLFMRRLLLKTR